MVLIMANREDPCGQWVQQALRKRGRQVLALNEDDMISRLQLRWASTRPPDESVLEYEGCRIRFDEITGVLARTWNVWVKDPEMTEKDQLYASFELQAALSGILSVLPCRVVNRPVLGMSYSPIFSHHKTYRAVVEAGFEVPETLVTSNLDTALAFYERCGRKAVMGSPSNLIPRRLVEGNSGEEDLRAVPADKSLYLQAIPEGRWVQVTVVGDRTFGYGSLWNSGEVESLPEVPLPPDVAEMSRRVAGAIHLDFAELLLYVVPDGAPLCYDLNSFPRYWNCSDKQRDAITETLATLLEMS